MATARSYGLRVILRYADEYVGGWLIDSVLFRWVTRRSPSPNLPIGSPIRSRLCVACQSRSRDGCSAAGTWRHDGRDAQACDWPPCCLCTSDCAALCDCVRAKKLVLTPAACKRTRCRLKRGVCRLTQRVPTRCWRGRKRFTAPETRCGVEAILIGRGCAREGGSVDGRPQFTFSVPD